MRQSRSRAARHSRDIDVAIIGAGAAGLSCARELLRDGKEVVILEARDRIGGRIHTTRFSDLDLPIELGAEFIHGSAKATYTRADDLGLVYCDSAESHLIVHGGASTSKSSDGDAVFSRMEALFKKLDPARKKDRSVAAFLAAHKASAAPDTLLLAKAFVEGFQAADLNLMGERALALAEGTDDDETMKATRLAAGYQRLIDGFLEGIENARSRLHLSSIVKEVRWKRGSVHLTVVSPLGFPLEEVRAARLVCTVPVGVLKAAQGGEASVAFQPEPPGLRSALAGVHMGHALRIVFRFRSRFWEELAPPSAKATLGYLHAGWETDFPTWWTTLPVRSPVMVAWQGGPRAAQLSLLSEHARVDTALSTLSRLLGCTRQLVERELQGWKTHNWSNDPFSLGGYSYVGVDGTAGAERLAHPVEDTLYFAGEAICSDTARGTVDGAIQSGVRAARQILRQTPP